MSDFNVEFEEQDQVITLEFEQAGGGAVRSVNGKVGEVVLDASDVGAYVKPSGGIPKTDLASAVQTSLGKADSAYQKPSSGIPASDMASGAIPVVDAALTTQGAAADAKKTGDEISDLKDGLTAVESDVTDLKEDYTTILDSAYVTDTASGAIASFPDGADGVPVKSLMVDIEPVQDLHGQANPYPAGGSKNKCKPINNGTFNGVTVSTDATGKTTVTGTATGGGGRLNLCSDSFTLPAGTYTVSHNGSGTWGYTLSLSAPGGSQLYECRATSTSATITLSAETTLVAGITIESGKTYNGTIEPQIESGSSKTAYAPNANICPISGHTSAVVTRTGKNLLNPQNVLNNYYIDGNTKKITSISGTNVFYLSVTKNTTLNVSSDKGNRTAVAGYYKEPQTIANSVADTLIINSATQNLSFSFNTGECEFIAIYLNRDQTNKPTWVQVEVGSTATAYEPYNVQTVTIDLDGTRYGGSLDVGTGVLTVDRAIVDLGTLTYTYDSASKRFGTQSNAIPIKPISGATVLSNMICSQYKTVAGQNQYDDVTLDASISQGGGSSAIIRIRDTAYTDATAFKTAMNGVQLCYELATPTTVQLTAQQLSTLLGQNNIWSDAGDVEVTYRADTKLYINKVLNA